MARRQPVNPIGWILIGLGIYAGVITDIGRYAVFDYHFHHGDLPFGPAAALLETGLWTGTFLVLPLVILLFPDARLPRRWRLVLWAYLANAGLVAAYFLGAAAWAMTRQPIAVDGAGQLIKQPNPPDVTAVAVVLIVALPVFWASFVARQVLSWRQATGERRQQLKWLMSGAAITVLGLAGIFGFNSGPSLLIPEIASFFASFALPVAITVGILKYRLYEIDRIISRTLAYAIVTGVLVGVYTGLVLLATRVLSFHAPVAVAASTLTAAALFSPLRRGVQRAVDRRFNRARYDAEQDRGRIRGPADGRGRIGRGLRRPGPGCPPGPRTRLRIGVDQPRRAETSLRQHCHLPRPRRMRHRQASPAQPRFRIVIGATKRGRLNADLAAQ